MRKNSSNPQNLGPGPRPLIPEETVKLVKDMRRRLWRNRLKVAWREGKKRIIAVSIVIILYASLIGMMGMSGSREDDEETTEEETEEDDDAELSTVEGYMLVGVLLIGLYMLVWMGSFQAYMNIKKITNYTRIDVEHFYPSTIDRAALLRSNLRRAMLYAAVFALAVFLIFFPLAIERNAYIILLVSYCLYHFCLGTLLLILRAHSDYLKDANIARVGGISARKYPRHWIQWFTMIISFLYPVILLILIVQPLFGILLFIFIILGYRFWKGMVIPERTTLWHEDLVRLGVYGAPGSATGAPGYAKGYEVREMQERKRWYQRGMLDRRNYSMKEEATGFGVLDEVHRVIYERTTYRLPDHIAKIMVPVLVILACISFVVFIGVLLCTMYMLGLGKAMAVGRSRGGTFETTYLFPISGREIVFSRYPDKKRSILLFAGLIVFSIVGIAGADVSSMVTIKAIVWGLAGGAVITVFILSFIAFLVYMDMMSKQTLYVGDLSRVRRSPMNISSLVIVGAYIFGLFLGNLLLFFLIATLLGFTSYQGIIFVMVDIVLIVYLTRFLLNRAVSLYDSISIIR